MSLNYLTIDDFKLKGKIVGVRIDINSPLINGKIAPNERIEAHSKTLKKLSELGAKVIVLAHQGRPKHNDCISLENHLKLLEKFVGKKIKFINELYSKKVLDKIGNLKNGELLLLENLRFYDDEFNPNKKDNKILKLVSNFDFYIFDAFSVAHRNQTSISAIKNKPVLAGLIMEKELRGLNNILETKPPRYYIFGGAKPDDLVPLIEKGLKDKSVDLIFLTGVIGEIALHIEGFNIGKKFDFLKEKGYLDSYDKLKNLIIKHKSKFILPRDVVLEENGKRKEIPICDLKNPTSKNYELVQNNLIQDIGKDTIDFFSLFLKNANTIYWKGPPGNFEEKNFMKGSEELAKLITKTDAFTFMGGGHTTTLVKNIDLLDKFSYVSLAGGALVKFLCGESLPGIETLENSFNMFEKELEDFVVVGSNTVDYEIKIPKYFKDLVLGSKVEVKDDFKKTIGGGGINVSLSISRLGGKVYYIGNFSEENAEYLKKVLTKNKISFVNSKPTKKPVAKSVILDTEDDDRVILTYRGQNAFLDLNNLNLKEIPGKYFYFTSLTGKSFDTLLNLAKEIKKEDISKKICYNPSLYFIKSNRLDILKILKYVDILVLNYEEAEELFRANSLKEIDSNSKKFNFEVLIITNGEDGSYCFYNNKEYYQKAIKPNKIVDTTGAGDAFASTFFYFYVKGYHIKKALLYASINSSNVVSYKGAQDGLLYLTDIKNKEKNI